ncbi:MAG: adenylate/guanylate cyclase domain-containing protein [Limisphaerales bacterium]
MQEEGLLRRRLRLALICIVATGVILALEGRFALFNEAESYTQDLLTRRGKLTPADPRLVFVGINKPNYKGNFTPEEEEALPVAKLLGGGFPWTRQVWAELVEKLMQSGARLVVLDIVFASEGVGDALFADVLKRYPDRVVLGWNALEENGEFTFVFPNRSLIPSDDSRFDARVGFVAIWGDGDGVVRRGYYRMTMSDIYERVSNKEVEIGKDQVVESLSARTLRALGEADKLPALGQWPLIRYTGKPDTGFREISLCDIFLPNTWKQNYGGGAFFKDKIVLVGPTANIFQDMHTSPFVPARMKGPEVHLNLINAALNRAYIQATSYRTNLYIVACTGLLAISLCLTIKSPIRRLLVIAALSLLHLFGFAQWLFDARSLLVPAFTPLLVLNLSGIGALGYEFTVELLARRKLRATMDLYFSPKVSAYVLANPGSMEARSAEVTLLLTDLRNSTPLAEMLGPSGMFSLLNHVFEVETNAVMAEDGALEHFLGDQFLTYWGAPLPQPEGPNQALRAAMQLIKGMEVVKDALSPDAKALFGYGVALHCGSVLFGNKGSAKRLDFGLVGDTVNEAARIESLTKYYHVTLLVSRECFVQLTNPGLHRLLDRAIVKGKSKPVELFEIENPRTPPNYGELVKAWDIAFADYTAGKFAEARPAFAKLAEQFDDGPSKLMVHRCEELAAHPPADWLGVWKMESK